MLITDLPAPVLTLVEAGRRALGAPAFDRPRTFEDTQETLEDTQETLTEWSLRHGMIAWAHRPLREDAVVTHMARSLAGLRQLLEIVERFERSGIRLVALKGPAFSQWVYGDAGARRFSDLDLLVSPDTRHAARSLLEEMGFQRRIPGRAGDIVYAGTGAWPMVHASRVDVDLHWTLAGRRFSRALEATDVLREAIEVSIAGRRVRAPCPEHAAILALTHSAKHLWYALELPFSIAALVCRADLDWNHVRYLAVRAGALRAAVSGLVLAADLFGVEVPAPFRDSVSLPDVQELCSCGLTALALPPGTFAGRRLERRMHLLSLDRPVDRLMYDVRRLTEPTRAEWEWVALPPVLARLYWPTRLVRMALMGMNRIVPPHARS